MRDKPIKRLCKQRRKAALSREISEVWAEMHRAKVRGDGHKAWTLSRHIERLEAEMRRL